MRSHYGLSGSSEKMNKSFLLILNVAFSLDTGFAA